MKHDWEYKKLKDVSVIVGGSTPKTDIPSYWDGEYSWITPAELVGSKYIEKTERHITDEALTHTNLQLLPIGTVLLTSRAPIGKVAITKIPMYCNQGFKNIVPNESLYNEFAYWYMTFKKDYIISLGRGATFKEISKSITEQIPIPVPPLPVQQQIVSELDKLNLVIEKKKQQVKELDKLAQAIFYDMFGDPRTNLQDLEVKRLGDLCKTITKGTTPTTLGYFFVSEGVNFIKVESFKDGKIDPSKLTHITKECNEALLRSQLDDLDLLVCIAGATIGKTAIVDKSILPANTNQACAIIRLKDSKNIVYIKTFLQETFKFNVEQMGKGVAQPNLSLGQMRELLIPLPSINLQQTFAAKVEAIERQKELINQSIREAQTLFDSRMEYYFGE